MWRGLPPLEDYREPGFPFRLVMWTGRRHGLGGGDESHADAAELAHCRPAPNIGGSTGSRRRSSPRIRSRPSWTRTGTSFHIWALLRGPARRGAPAQRGDSARPITIFGGRRTPGRAGIWSPRETTALKLLYGQAFRASTPSSQN